ncbi:uncharacterized protein [Amphiura filiformis]|uniref:uncharacterized protein n=1 Tax=Amphiura filiformis TaxID=82378 RepID=UPI003B21674D
MADEPLMGDEQKGDYGSVSSDDKSPNTATPKDTLDEISTVSSTTEHGVQALHVMIASFIGSVGIVFGVIPILIPSNSFKLLRLDLIPYIGRTLCSLVLLTLSTFFILWRRCTSSSVVPTEEEALSCGQAFWKRIKNFGGFVVYQYPALIQIFVFAIGSVATCALDIYNHSKNYHVYMPVFLIQDTSRMLSLLSQMVLYSWFLYDRPRVLPGGYFGFIALMIGAEVWLWISDTTEPLWTIDGDLAGNRNDVDDNEFAEGLEHFLEPFYIEFSTISIGLLYELWSHVPDKKDHDKEHVYPSLSLPKTHKVFSVLLFILYVSISSLILFAHCSRCAENELVVFIRIMIYKGFLFLLYGFGLLFITVKALRLLTSDAKSSATSLGQYLLIITAIVMFVFYILRIFAAAYDLHYDEIKNQTITINESIVAGEEFLVTYRSVTLKKHLLIIPNITHTEVLGMDGVMLTYPFFIIAQVWTQSHLLIEAQRHKKIPDFVKTVLLYIIMMNFAEWLQTGIALGFDRDGGKSATTPIMDTFFSDQGARIIRLCLYPFMVLYRFHLAVVAWEILVENASEEEDEKEGDKEEGLEDKPEHVREVEDVRKDEGQHEGNVEGESEA